MALDSTDLDLAVARAGAARAGATRAGFAPDDVRGTAIGSQSGPLYGWQNATPNTEGETWTTVEDANP